MRPVDGFEGLYSRLASATAAISHIWLLATFLCTRSYHSSRHPLLNQGCRGRSLPAGVWGVPQYGSNKERRQKGENEDKEAVQMAY